MDEILQATEMKSPPLLKGVWNRSAYPILKLVPLLKNFIHVENCEQIQKVKAPVIFAFNHNCSYETLLVPAFVMYLRQWEKISFIIDWMYGQIPILKWLFNQVDPIYVYNKRARFIFFEKNRHLNRMKDYYDHKTVYNRCIDYLSLHRSIGIFPEGKRNKNPTLLSKGRSGIGRIVLESNVPVLPIGIDFPNRINNHKIPKFGSIILRAGEVLEFPNERKILTELPQHEDLSPHSVSIIKNYLSSKITYAVMSRLSELSGKEYPFTSPERPEEVERFL